MTNGVLTVLHAADLHMDSPLEGLPEGKVAIRRRELRSLPERIALLAEERQADVILLAGDLLDSGSPYRETSEALMRCLGRISAPVFIAPGNHDYYTARSPYAAPLPDNVHVFKTGEMECVELPQLRLRVWGAGFTQESSPPLLQGFSAHGGDDTLDICVLHGDALSPASGYDPISREDIENSGLLYLALGHSHSFSQLKKAGDTYYAWPGCPEGRGFDETGDRGLIIARLSPGKCEAEFVPLAARRYEILSVDVTEKEPQAAVAAALPEGTETDIYRLLLTGEASPAPDVRALFSALEPRFFHLQLRDETIPRRDIWESCGQDTLKGLFLQKLRARLDAAGTEAERQRIVRAVRYGLAALENGEEP